MSNHSSALPTHHQHISEKCPECGSPLQIRNGKQGPFFGCSSYPKCTYLRPLHEKSEIKKVLSGTHCPLCNKELVLKQGRYGLFIGCSMYARLRGRELGLGLRKLKDELADEKRAFESSSNDN